MDPRLVVFLFACVSISYAQLFPDPVYFPAGQDQPYYYKLYTIVLSGTPLWRIASYRIEDGVQVGQGYYLNGYGENATALPVATADDRNNVFIVFDFRNSSGVYGRIVKCSSNPIDPSPVQTTDVAKMEPLLIWTGAQVIVGRTQIFTYQGAPTTFGSVSSYDVGGQGYNLLMGSPAPNFGVINLDTIAMQANYLDFYTGNVSTVTLPSALSQITAPPSLCWAGIVVATPEFVYVYAVPSMNQVYAFPINVTINYVVFSQSTSISYLWSKTERTLIEITWHSLDANANFSESRRAVMPLAHFPFTNVIGFYFGTSLYTGALVWNLICETATGIAIVPAVCDAGFYSSVSGCQRCQLGKPQTSWSVNGPDACTDCGDGWFIDYKLNLLSNDCVKCPLGQTSTIESRLFNSYDPCFACPVGEYGNGLSGVCQQCPVGLYTNVTNRENCASCPQGYRAENDVNIYTNASFIQDIPAYQRSTSCVKCPAGSYGVQATITTINNPPTGVTGGFCIICPDGAITATDGLSEYTLCPPGTTSNENHTECVACPENTYNQGYGSTTCDLCPIASYSLPNSTSCLPCPAGTYGQVAGEGCLACGIGTYSPLPNSTGCIACGDDNFCPTQSSKIFNAVIAQPVVQATGVSNETEQTISRQYALVLIIVGSIVLAILIVALLLTYCSRKAGLKFDVVMRTLDLFYSTDHYIRQGQPVVNKKQVSGGFSSVAAIGTILALVIASSVDYVTNNVTVRTSIVPGTPEVAINRPVFSELLIHGDTGGCKVNATAFGEANEPELLGDGSCRVTWNCSNCDFTKNQKVSFTIPYEFAAVISYNVSVTVPYFEGKTFSLSTVIVPPSRGSVFSKGETTLTVLATPALFKTLDNQNSFAYVMQYSATSPSAYSAGGTVAVNIDDPVTFTLDFQPSSVSYVQEEVEKTSTLNFLGQLLALIGGSISFWKIVLTGFENIRARVRGGSTKQESATVEMR